MLITSARSIVNIPGGIYIPPVATPWNSHKNAHVAQEIKQEKARKLHTISPTKQKIYHKFNRSQIFNDRPTIRTQHP